MNSAEVKELKEFSDTYLGYLYRLSVKQYEDDYQEIKQYIDEVKHSKGAEPNSKINKGNKAKGKPPIGSGPDNYHESTLMNQDNDFGEENLFITDKQMNGIEEKTKKFVVKSGNGGMNPKYLSHSTKPKKLSRELLQPEGLTDEIDYNLIKEAKTKKRILEKQLREIEHEVHEMKRMIIRKKKGVPEQGVPESKDRRPYSKNYSSYDHRTAEEAKTDSRRKNRYLETDSYSYERQTPGVDYAHGESPKKNYVDIASFIKRMNEEKREREVKSN
jgi:hypothetical protein